VKRVQPLGKDSGRRYWRHYTIERDGEGLWESDEEYFVKVGYVL
jgi:hypothetical protein